MRRLALVTMLLMAGCQKPATPEADDKAPVPVVKVTTARYAPMEETVKATGTLSAPREEQATVSPPVSGIVQGLYVRIGQTVSAGQTVAQLSTRPVEGQIAQAQAQVAQNEVQVQQAEATALQQRAQSRSALLQAQAAVSAARATLVGAQATLSANQTALVNARQTYARLKTLNGDGLVSQKDLQAAEAAVHTAEAQVASQAQAVVAQRQQVESQEQAVEAARAAQLQDQVKQKDIEVAQAQVRNAQGQLLTAEGQRSLYTLTAPLSGRVLAIGASVGETVDATTKVVTLANIRTLQVQLSVPARLAPQVHVGQAVRCRVDGVTGTLTSHVDLVGTQVDPTSDAVTVRATLSNPGQRIANGAYTEADIVVKSQTRALSVPKSALLDAQGEEAKVLVVGDDKVAHVTPVKLGIQTDRAAEIVDGVKEGATVVSDGGYGVADGTKVQVAAP